MGFSISASAQLFFAPTRAWESHRRVAEEAEDTEEKKKAGSPSALGRGHPNGCQGLPCPGHLGEDMVRGRSPDKWSRSDIVSRDPSLEALPSAPLIAAQSLAEIANGLARSPLKNDPGLQHAARRQCPALCPFLKAPERFPSSSSPPHVHQIHHLPFGCDGLKWRFRYFWRPFWGMPWRRMDREWRRTASEGDLFRALFQSAELEADHDP